MGLKSGYATIPHRAFRTALNKVMHLHGKYALKSNEEIQCLIDEIADNHERLINFRAFCQLFTGMIIG